MNLISAPSTAAPVPARDVSIDYLRATLTMLVIAHHSALAYTTFARFDPKHHLASTAPVVDAARWAPLDYLVSANDTFFMSLMFFVSGLFVWLTVERAGPVKFLRDRALRLGTPFVVGALTVAPLSYWASWRMTGATEGFEKYWWLNLTGGWPSGPLWFIWMLLAFNILAALAAPAVRRLTMAWGPSRMSPLAAVAVMGALSAGVYIPLLLEFGFDRWGAFLTPPLWFQVPRLGLYLLWFCAGVWWGRRGIPSMMSSEGPLARSWFVWAIAACLAFIAFVMVPGALTANGCSFEPRRNVIEGLLWVACCVLGCFAMLGVFRAKFQRPNRIADSFSRCAYAIYLLHYVFVVWIQFGMLNSTLAPCLKFIVTFVGATCLSWMVARLLLTIPILKRIL